MIKAGILGSHNNIKEHLSLLRNMPLFNIIGIHDTNVTENIELQNQHQLKIYSQPEEMFQDVDVLFTAPSFNSYQWLQNAIRKSNHLFVNPPVRYNNIETQNLIKLSDEADVVVHIGFKHRYNPAFLAAKPFINPRVRMIHVYNLKQYRNQQNINPIDDLMAHDIDNILRIVNSEIKKISAYGMSTSATSPDIVNAIIEFHNGCVANLTAGKIASRNKHSAVFYNPKDYISIDMIKNKAYRYHKNTDNDIALFSTNFSDLIQEKIPVKNANELEDEMNAFSNSILKIQRPELSLENANRTMNIIEEIKTKVKLTSNCS